MSLPKPFYRWRAHPWHGLEVGPDPPRIVHAYIEITPFDLVKYEIDKVTGYMRLDRPQRTSSLPPTLYGFIPRTYCADRVHALSPRAERADADPLDICIISERLLNRSEMIVSARVVGGLQAIDSGEADDKIFAVLDNEEFWEDVDDVSQLPSIMVQRLKHYFATYKMTAAGESLMSIERVYDRERALQVVAAAMADYDETFGGQR
jgi:inorganic pyrophosphatase